MGLGFLYPKSTNPPKVIYKVLNTERHKRARREGYQARVDDRSMSDNPYSKLSNRLLVFASVWDAGWNTANENIAKSNAVK